MTTKIEKIKAFNATHADPKPSEDDGGKDNPQPQDDTRTAKEKIVEKAEENKAKTKEEIEQEKLDAEEAERQRQADVLAQLTDATSSLIDRVNARVNPVKDWIASQPTPGGIAALLIFILFMASAIIPVNDQGETRLQLFYQTLLGRTHMKYRETYNVGGTSSTNPTIVGGSSSANFGTGQGGKGASDLLAGIDMSNLNLFGSQ